LRAWLPITSVSTRRSEERTQCAACNKSLPFFGYTLGILKTAVESPRQLIPSMPFDEAGLELYATLQSFLEKLQEELFEQGLRTEHKHTFSLSHHCDRSSAPLSIADPPGLTPYRDVPRNSGATHRFFHIQRVQSIIDKTIAPRQTTGFSSASSKKIRCGLAALCMSVSA